MPGVGVSNDPEKRGMRVRDRRLPGLLPALIGLSGVLIGALVTAGITYLGDRSNRIADERTATRLIANEIRLDTSRLVLVSVYGRRIGAPLRTVEWESEASTLARFVPNSNWVKVSGFYDDLLNIKPSLSGRCVTAQTRRYAATVAREGNAAYEALRHEPVPAVEKLGSVATCR
jgi:hypothetical protein